MRTHRYGASRGLSSTPSFLLNGVAISADPSWSVDQWKQVIDPVLKPLELPRELRADAEEMAVAAKRRDQNDEGGNKTCAANTTKCEPLPGKIECCRKGEFCIPNVGCTC